MPDRYIFTPPSAIIPMVEDLRVLATIESDALQRISDLLAQQTGFLTDERLASLVSECIDDEDQRSAVFNALQNLGPGGDDRILAMLRAWRESDEQRRSSLPDDAFAALEEKLPTLVRDYPALSRSKKADRLRTVLGNELEAVAFICDAQPVYDVKRSHIEGLIPLTTMKLVYERQNSDTAEVEIILNGAQLKDLISKARQAEEKLSVLCESIETWIPDGCIDAEEETDADEA